MFKKILFLFSLLITLTGCGLVSSSINTKEVKETNNIYVITFESNGGSYVEPIAQEANTDITEPKAPTKEGFNFIGWYKDNEFNEPFVFSKMPKGNIILYAKWEKNDPMKPVFSNIPDDQVIIYGTKLDLLSLGLTAYDDVDGDLTSNITVDVNDTSILSVGVHTITYSVIDSSDNEATISINIIVNSQNAEYFILNEEGDKIIDYDPNGGKYVVIPKYINGKLITKIGDKAFYQKNIKHVKLPDSITTIGSYAFADNSLTSIILPEKLTKLEAYAFAWNLLENLTIPDSVTRIEDSAFYSNLLTSLTISNGVTIIEDFAFTDNLLESLTIPDSVTIIGDKAFYKNNLTSITIPNSVTKIGSYAFDFNNLDNVYVSSNHPYFKIENNLLLTKDGTTLIALIGRHDSITIPNTVTTIIDWAFANNNLTSITIPNSVTSIGYGVFLENSLINVTIPNSVTSLGSHAFYKNNLLNVNISNSITTIEEFTFYGNNLTSVSLPDSVTTIEQYAFGNNSLESLVIPNSVKTIKASAFYNNNLTNVTIPDSVIFIGDCAFYNNNITNITIPDSVMTLGHVVFDFHKLENFHINSTNPYFNVENDLLLTKDNQTLIAFIGSHESIDIPYGVTTISDFAFYNNSLTSVTIPDTVTTIGNNAFSDNNLTNVMIPNSVTQIGIQAFYRNKLTSITIPENVKTIGNYAFDFNRLTNVIIEGEKDRFNDRWSIIGFPVELKP